MKGSFSACLCLRSEDAIVVDVRTLSSEQPYVVLTIAREVSVILSGHAAHSATVARQLAADLMRAAETLDGVTAREPVEIGGAPC